MNSSVPTAARKAAILVSSLDIEAADRLLEHLPAELASSVRALSVTLDDVTDVERDMVIREFFNAGGRKSRSAPQHQDQAQQPTTVDEDDDGGVELHLSSAEAETGDRAQQAAADPPSNAIQAGHSSPHGQAANATNRASFAFLQQAEPASLSTILRDEHPQTVAVVVAHLPRDRAAQLLAELAQPLRDEIVRRILHLGEMHPDILDDLKSALALRFDHLGLSHADSTHGQTILQEILEAASPHTLQKLGNSLASTKNPLGTRGAASTDDPAAAVGNRQFEEPRPMTFADVQRLSGDAIFTVFTTVSPEEAILALFDAPDAFIQRVLDQLSPRESRVWRYALAHPGPTRLADVTAAQVRIAAAADELAAAGRINVPFQHMALVA